MLKKFFYLIKIVIITPIWTILYFWVARWFLLFLWNFDIFSFFEASSRDNDWLKIAEFWNRGGVINTLKDIAFMFSISLFFPLWLYSLYKLIKVKFINIVLYPLERHNKKMLEKYGGSSSRIVFKNLTTAREDVSIDDMVNQKMKQLMEENEKDLESDKIRTIIKDKIKNKK